MMPVNPQMATVRISFFCRRTRFCGSSVNTPRITVATINRTTASVSGGYVVYATLMATKDDPHRMSAPSTERMDTALDCFCSDTVVFP